MDKGAWCATFLGGHKEWDATEQLSMCAHARIHTHIHIQYANSAYKSLRKTLKSGQRI